MYFSNFPLIVYDSVGNGNFKIVTNLMKRVAMRTKVRTNTLFFDTYDVKEGETPEILADKLYGDSNLHWIILYVNNITDRYHQWPMSSGQFNDFIADKYSNIDAVHHYEVSQTSGDTSVKIDIGTDTTGYSEADLTTITNREFEEERQDTIRQIRLLDPTYVPQFIEEFETLIGSSVL
tara:strand:+ start:1291 stop:1824 length:534 start_codon:yes stop_codon:yes gene_type:complete